jgi:hypothetical protein
MIDEQFSGPIVDLTSQLSAERLAGLEAHSPGQDALACAHGVQVNLGRACKECEENLAEDEKPTPSGRIQLQELADNLRTAAAKLDDLAQVADEEVMLVSSSVGLHCGFLPKEKQQEFVRALGKCEKHTSGSSLWVSRDFGQDAWSKFDVTLHLKRDDFCRPIITGKKIIPATPEREVDVIEYECGSILGS